MHTDIDRTRSCYNGKALIDYIHELHVYHYGKPSKAHHFTHTHHTHRHALSRNQRVHYMINYISAVRAVTVPYRITNLHVRTCTNVHLPTRCNRLPLTASEGGRACRLGPGFSRDTSFTKRSSGLLRLGDTPGTLLPPSNNPDYATLGYSTLPDPFTFMCARAHTTANSRDHVTPSEIT